MRSSLIFLPPCLLLAVQMFSSAAIYYVDATAGNDTNPGSLAEPWKTLGHAGSNAVTSGDSVLLKRGETWNEAFTFGGSGVTLADYGTGALPILDGQNALRSGVITTGVSNTVTRNLNVRNFGNGQTGSLWNNAVGTNWIEGCTLQIHTFDSCISVNAGFAYITNCFLSDAADQGITMHGTSGALVNNCVISNCLNGFKNSGDAFTLEVNDTIITDNSIDIDALDTGTTVFNRCRFNGRSDGTVWTFFKACTDSVSFNSCIFDASRGSAIASFGMAGPTVLLNCTFYGKTNESMSVSAGISVFATNCLFQYWNSDVYYFSGGTVTADHCIFRYTGTKDISTNLNEVAGDPAMVNPSAGNFQLQPTSVAINSGVDVGLSTDYAGTAINGLPDIGAYEYVAPTAATLKATIGGGWIVPGGMTLR